MQKRTGSAVWQGDLKGGKGVVSSGSGALKATPYSFAMRFEGTPGTNPEELIAAAQAGCFAMALSEDLGNAGFTADKLDAKATVTLDKVDGKATLTAMHIVVTGKVPKIDAKKFQEIANGTKSGCPISRALKMPITLEAKLES
jgi:lipoyl-dependent peroxiredoxin